MLNHKCNEHIAIPIISEYCQACESRFEDEHVVCRKINMQEKSIFTDKKTSQQNQQVFKEF